MLQEDRFVLVANIERFTNALLCGCQDVQQEATVKRLLSEYRQRLAALDRAALAHTRALRGPRRDVVETYADDCAEAIPLF